MATPSVYELSSKNGNDSVLTASRGTYILNNTVAYSGLVRAIVVLEDTVFSSIKHDGDATEQKTAYIANSAVAIKAGAIITPTLGNIFDTVTLTSGSVSLVL